MSANPAVLNWRDQLGFSDSAVQRELVQRAQAGDAEAFGYLYDGFIERIYRYVFFRVTDEQTAEDLTAQVFTKAWEKLDHYKPSGAPFIAWLYTIARNIVIDFYRTRKETVDLEDAVSIAHDGPQPEDQVALHFEVEELRIALQQLTADQQQVVVLKFINGLSTEEIAQQLGKRTGAIRALQMRALQSLARLMREETAPEPA
jgi:RNA polymerase sigma-70 factor (ECF subfamily)